jgi:hypothetical protein
MSYIERQIDLTITLQRGQTPPGAAQFPSNQLAIP